MTAAKSSKRVISVHCGQTVQFPVQARALRAIVEQIREIRTGRYVESFTGPEADVVLTLQMSDGSASARAWQVIF